MVHFVLDDLRRPAGILLPLLLPAAVQIFHFDVLIPGGLPDTIQGKAAFLRLIGRILLYDDRVIHYHVHEAHIDDDDPLLHGDHVCRHTDAAILIGFQCILQVLTDGHVLLLGFLGFLTEEDDISDDGFNHIFSSIPVTNLCGTMSYTSDIETTKKQ